MQLCGFDHHENFLQGVGPSVELSPVDPILVATSIVSTPIPHAVQIGVCAHVIPPASFLVMSAVTCEKHSYRHKKSNHFRKLLGWDKMGTDLDSCPCRGPEWWRPCCCAMTGSLLHCRGIVPSAGGTSHSPVPGGSCHSQQTPAGPANLLRPPGVCTWPAGSASRGVPGQASTHHLGFQSLAVIMQCKKKWN